ncbi:replication initiation protein, partial [Endozoicomonas sp. ONNA1]|uniref:replication initiation protein n=1 Tax=Endozoicomonas sp. ONNA1 TaxID=2828740 RepID=UPI002148FA39
MKSQDENNQEQVESSMSIIREDVEQDHKLVLKGNALIEARYGISVTAQKLFLGLIARVDPTASELPTFRLTKKDMHDLDIGVGKQTAYRNYTSACLELLGLRVSLVEKNMNTGEVEDTDINIFSRNTRRWNDASREELKEVEFRFTKDVEPYLRDFSSDIR